MFMDSSFLCGLEFSNFLQNVEQVRTKHDLQFDVDKLKTHMINQCYDERELFELNNRVLLFVNRDLPATNFKNFMKHSLDFDIA